MKEPEILDSTPIIDAAISVRKDLLRYPNAHIQDYFVVTSRAESVAIVAISQEGHILVTREYRHPVKRFVLGLPGGLVNHGEKVIDAARRELLEETGCTARVYEVLGCCYPLPGILAQRMSIVLAKDAKITHPTQLEATETIQASFQSQEDLDELIRNAVDIDSTLCTALLFYRAAKRAEDTRSH